MKKIGSIMKIQRITYFYLLSILLFVGCVSQENELTKPVENREIHIYASSEDLQLTKAELQEGNSIRWIEGDAIRFFYDHGSDVGGRIWSSELVFERRNTGDKTTAFGGKIDGTCSGERWAVSPYNSQASCNLSSITTIMPSVQIAKAGSFDKNALISIAKSTDNEMFFQNVCGGIKFSVTQDGIGEVIFKNNDGGFMAGTITVGFDGHGTPMINSITDGSTMVRVVAPNGGVFEVGKFYYAIVLPTVFKKGISIKFVTTDGKEAYKTIERSSTVERRKFSRLLQIDSGLEFIEHPAYLTFESEGKSVLSTASYGFEYSFDGIEWEKYWGSPIEFTSEQPLFLRGKNTNPKQIKISGSKVACYGDIMNLVDYDKTSNDISDFFLTGLFKDCKLLTRAPELSAATLPNGRIVSISLTGCYEEMFRGCSSLVIAPELPATALTDHCYEDMFRGCSSLVAAPKLPANTLAKSCYCGMFRGCSSLVNAPELPVTTLSKQCYCFMFSDCAALKTAPELPATTLTEGCYWGMFSGCDALKTAPKLPATTLAESCYCFMFSDCAALKTAPELPATTLAESCYWRMFSDCDALKTAPELPATTLAESCYEGMFSGCSSLVNAPKLPATTLTAHCYAGMFQDCGTLETAPALPATTLADYCYYEMFYKTSLVTVPVLPANTLADHCYEEMFRGCFKVDYIKALFTSVGEDSLKDWLNGVSETGTFVSNPNSTLARYELNLPVGWQIK